MIKIESSRQTWTADPQKSKSRKQSDGKTFTFDTKSILFVRYLRSCKSQKTMPELCKCRHCQHYPSTSKAILNSSFIFECMLTSELTLSHWVTAKLQTMEEHVEKHLRGRRILNINSRSLIDPDIDPPAPGVPPTVSNQGQSSVCASHAVGKGKKGNNHSYILYVVNYSSIQ